MTVTANQFERTCKDFRRYAKEAIDVSFMYGFFYVTGSKEAIENIKKMYKDNKKAYIENDMFILTTPFKGKFDTTQVK